MKYFLMILTLISNVVLASDVDSCKEIKNDNTVLEKLEIDTKVPEHLKDAQICIFKKETGYKCVSAAKFKVVPRKQQFIVTKIKESQKTLCSSRSSQDSYKKNRINLLAGNGSKPGLHTSSSGNKVTIESNSGPVGGIQYQRKLNKKLNAGIQIQSNETIMLDVGLDF